jgi:hypothetical protein
VFGLNNQAATSDENQSVDSVSYFGNSSCWTYKANLYASMFNDFIPTTTYGSTQGDTIINNHSYLKFYSETGSYYAIRQENKKIYAKYFDQSQEFLLYDFNVNKGDTIHSAAQRGYISRLPIVSDVDSVQLYNGEYRKRFIVNGYDTWTEGIGSINGFDYPTREIATCNCNSSFELISFAREKVLSFYNTALCAYSNCCQGLTDNVKDIQEQQKVFDIYPNPTKDVITVKFGSNIAKSNFELFDLQGKIVISVSIDETNNTIHLNQLPNGIYFYKISADGKSLQTGKISKE